MDVETLVRVIPLLNCDLKMALSVGAEYGLSRHDVGAIRHILKYSGDQLGGKLSEDQKEEICREYEQGGISIWKLAKKYSVTYNSVYIILKARGVDTQSPNTWSHIKEMRLIECIKKGMPTSSIAALLGKSKNAVDSKIERMKKKGII